MPTQSKEILNDPVDMKESLSLVGRLEAPHLAFALSGWLMRYFGSIVRIPRRIVGYQRHDCSMCCAVASELVRNQTKRFTALTLQELSKESSRRSPVPTRL